MSFRTFFLATALLTLSQVAAGADHPPTAEDRAATQDAFAISMYDPQFVAAAKAGKAHEMKAILLANGAPGDLELTARGISVDSTNGNPEPSQYPNNDGICTAWRLVTWYSSIPPYNSYTMWVCVRIISHAGVVTYDAR